MHRAVFTLYFLAVSVSLVPAQVSQQQCRTAFRQVSNGSLCIRSDFTRTLDGIASDWHCALRCETELDCRAFTTADGPCQLFVFDKCSKSVRNCSCSRRGRLFVKRQPGLEPGSLCPLGYGDGLCGVKYRLINSTAKWSYQKQRCESDSELSILADVTDAAELSHVKALYTAHNPGIAVYLGGYWMFPSSALEEGWYWAGCNTTLVAFVWGTGEPNDSDEKATALYPTLENVVDIQDLGLYGALCECVSPFD